MVFQRFYNEMLAQASYLVGCSATGEAIVIDPNRDADQYIEAARKARLRIVAVTETHIHADYLSGLRELAARTGAKMYVSDEGGPDWRYAFRGDANVETIKDGGAIRVGNVRLDVVHTPGHTPEHVSFILTDEPASERPLGAFTGDFVFVGDVGRPDLLERAAKISGTMEVGGRQLFASLQRFANREDGLLVWPGHGAGSACGKNLGGMPFSSLGYEKAANWAFGVKAEDAFVKEVLSGQPEPPYYFATMKRLNREGQVLGSVSKPPPLAPGRAWELAREGAQVVDLRLEDVAIEGFIPGTVCIPHDKEFLKWAGWFLRYDSPIYLIAKDAGEAWQAARDLALIGLDGVAGWALYEALEAGETVRVPSCDFGEADALLLDVRSTAEYTEGHVPGSTHVPLGYLLDSLEQLPREAKIAVHCATGSRSRLASILLRGHGFCRVCNVSGGFDAYNSRGLPVEVGGGRPERV